MLQYEGETLKAGSVGFVPQQAIDIETVFERERESSSPGIEAKVSVDNGS